MNFTDKFIVDFQYLCGNSKNEFFIKEIAICELETLQVKSYHLQPPYSSKHLTNYDSIRTNNFMEKNFNIKWEDGNVSYLKLDKIFDKLNGKIIFVKGYEKKKIVEQYVDKYTKVENLEIQYDHIPSLKSLQYYKLRCAYHCENKKSLCARNKVMNLMIFMYKNIE